MEEDGDNLIHSPLLDVKTWESSICRKHFTKATENFQRGPGQSLPFVTGHEIFPG